MASREDKPAVYPYKSGKGADIVWDDCYMEVYYPLLDGPYTFVLFDGDQGSRTFNYKTKPGHRRTTVLEIAQHIKEREVR
jgi:hypothetical protein